MRKWKVLAHHKWVAGATITESVDLSQETKETTIRRFTATIRGHRGLVIYEGNPNLIDVNQVSRKVQEIKERIDADDLSVLKENIRIA